MENPRIVQATIAVSDRAELIRFYETAFAATFDESIGSFTFGAWPGDDFFLLTLAHDERHPGLAGPARFGLVVGDVDAAHRRALDAGAVELDAPVDKPWKPRWSCVADPAGNRIDLYQG